MLSSNIPTIDLHGETRDTARILVNEVHNMLKKDKRIEKYYIDFFNVGSTIVIIKEKS